MTDYLTDTNVGNIEYIRRQDAFDAVEARITELMTHPEFRRKHLDIDLSGFIRNISAIKPADVVPVVRCMDCKHYYFADNRIPQEQRYVCEISGEIWKPDSFCSYGEREE